MKHMISNICWLIVLIDWLHMNVKYKGWSKSAVFFIVIIAVVVATIEAWK